MHQWKGYWCWACWELLEIFQIFLVFLVPVGKMNRRHLNPDRTWCHKVNVFCTSPLIIFFRCRFFFVFLDYFCSASCNCTPLIVVADMNISLLHLFKVLGKMELEVICLNFYRCFWLFVFHYSYCYHLMFRICLKITWNIILM